MDNDDTNNTVPENSTAEISKYIHALEQLVDGNSATESTKSEDELVKMLVKALADELLAWYQYWVCKNLVRGDGRADAIPEFDEHAKEEMDHANKLIERIKQLGGKPIYSPRECLAFANPWTEVNTPDACEQLLITIKAERDAIAYYQTIANYCKGFDEVTLCLIRSIMADEAKHKYDLEMLLEEHQRCIAQQ